MTVTFPIIALGDGVISDAAWFADITETVNAHETRLAVVESYNARIVQKALDETIISNATLQNDDALLLSMEASTTYQFKLWTIINTGATPDYKMGWSVPSGCTMKWSVQEGSAVVLAAALQGPFTEVSAVGINGIAADQIVIADGLVKTATTAGNLQYQWAQNTLTASNTSTKASSWLQLAKLI